MMACDSKEALKAFIPVCEELYIDHALYSELFETRALELYEKTAPHTFQDLLRILSGHLIIRFCRVTDPASTGQKLNLTTSYFIEQVKWPDEVLRKLTAANDRMIRFRDLVTDARNKRLAHLDLKAQTVALADLGAFSKGDDHKFLKDLGEFVNIAHEHLFGEPHPIDLGCATDASRLVRALEKAAIFDGCKKCSELERTKAVLDFERGN